MLSRKNYKMQNVLLLAASYFFYGFWDIRFCSLILLSTLIDFFLGRKIYQTENISVKKRLLSLSVIANLSILGFFKYFDFFADSLVQTINEFGFSLDAITLKIILPVGISFYTFQTLSYTIDVYRGRMKPADSLIDFGLFVSFFPQLVAGPIERASSFLPQIQKSREITADSVNRGIYLILSGFYYKMVVADNLGVIANSIFNKHELYTGLDLFIGVLAFAFQIFGDFCGYSQIARGISKLLGFDLMINFKLPYFAINPSDFWGRWHISLSSWLRDYLYISLGGNREGQLKTLRNLLITMLLGGLWHGASWNFVIWGAYHGIILIVFRLVGRDRGSLDTPFSLSRLYQIPFMFFLTLLGWILFRSESVEQIVYFISNIGIEPSIYSWKYVYELLFFLSPFLILNLYQYRQRNLLAPLNVGSLMTCIIYAFFIFQIVIFGVRSEVEFIYFQF